MLQALEWASDEGSWEESLPAPKAFEGLPQPASGLADVAVGFGFLLLHQALITTQKTLRAGDIFADLCLQGFGGVPLHLWPQML